MWMALMTLSSGQESLSWPWPFSIQHWYASPSYCSARCLWEYGGFVCWWCSSGWRRVSSCSKPSQARQGWCLSAWECCLRECFKHPPSSVFFIFLWNCNYLGNNLLTYPLLVVCKHFPSRACDGSTLLSVHFLCLSASFIVYLWL